MRGVGREYSKLREIVIHHFHDLPALRIGHTGIGVAAVCDRLFQRSYRSVLVVLLFSIPPGGFLWRNRRYSTQLKISKQSSPRLPGEGNRAGVWSQQKIELSNPTSNGGMPHAPAATRSKSQPPGTRSTSQGRRRLQVSSKKPHRTFDRKPCLWKTRYVGISSTGALVNDHLGSVMASVTVTVGASIIVAAAPGTRPKHRFASSNGQIRPL
jgi:hypothetical protein